MVGAGLENSASELGQRGEDKTNVRQIKKKDFFLLKKPNYFNLIFS